MLPVTSSLFSFQIQLQICIEEESRSHLESLLLQGDLIEVSLEETKWLWQLLQMSLPRGSACGSVENADEAEKAEQDVTVNAEATDGPPAKAARFES